MSTPVHTAARQALLANIRGQVLELGFGTGLNLPHYPRTVERLITVDPNPGMTTRAQERIAASPIPVEQLVLDGAKLPVADASLDCVVSTWTLCSIPELTAALQEVRRVLRPEGQFFFLEHGLSPDSNVSRWQHRLNRFQMACGDGCRLDRNFKQLIPAAGFALRELAEYYQEKTPRTHGYSYRGIAIPSSVENQ